MHIEKLEYRYLSACGYLLSSLCDFVFSMGPLLCLVTCACVLAIFWLTSTWERRLRSKGMLLVLQNDPRLGSHPWWIDARLPLERRGTDFFIGWYLMSLYRPKTHFCCLHEIYIKLQILRQNGQGNMFRVSINRFDLLTCFAHFFLNCVITNFLTISHSSLQFFEDVIF